MYSNWLPAISQRIDKTSKENYVKTYLLLFHHCLLLCGYVMFKNSNLRKPNGGHKQPSAMALFYLDSLPLQISLVCVNNCVLKLSSITYELCYVRRAKKLSTA